MRCSYRTLILEIFGIWLLLFFTGCQQPFCHIFSACPYRVDQLDEYIEYVAGADLYSKHRTAVLKFSCEVLRDQLTLKIHEYMVSEAPFGENIKMRDETIRLGLIGARREGNTLHMMNDVTVGIDGLDEWASQFANIVQSKPKDVRDNWLPEVMRRLFHSVILHAGEKQVEIPITSKHSCD